MTNITVSYSEEIQDVIHFAKKTATKDKAPCMQDRHLLAGLFQINRLFTRLDALLKQSGVSPKKLSHVYQAEMQNHSDFTQPASALDKAAEIAQKADTGKKARVEVEHLLMALFLSPDPVVQQAFLQAEFTPDALEKAIPQVSQGSPIRFTMYTLRETLEVIVVVLFLVIVIKQGIGEFRLIPSESMVPTLQIGDRIAVEKVTHWFHRIPQRGDVLVFYPPEPEAILKHDPWSLFLRATGFSGILYDKESKIDTAFIKRVVGLPGDVVEVRPGEGVYINGKLLSEPYAAEIPNTCTFINACGPVEVPPHEYYMMGDNRNHSADSRYWGFLPEERIIGRAVFRFYPFDKRLGPLKPPSESTTGNPSSS